MDNKKIMTTIGKRIAQRRIELGLTQSQLAKLAGFKSPGTIGNYESQTRGKPRELLRLAHALNVEPAWLESGSLPKEPTLKLDKTVNGLMANELLEHFNNIHSLDDKRKVLQFAHALAVLDLSITSPPPPQKALNALLPDRKLGIT